MKSALFAVAVTALAAGLVVAPATQQSAQALVYGGAKSGVPAPVSGDVILVKRGGGGHGGFRGGGGGFKGGGRAFRGGGGGFKGAYRGGGRSFKAYRGGGGRHVYRGGGKRYAYKGRGYPKYSYRGGKRYHGDRHYKGKRYAYRGRYYRRYYDGYWWYGPSIYIGAYGYGGCAWLRRQAIITGDPYWWDRYYDCIGYY